MGNEDEQEEDEVTRVQGKRAERENPRGEWNPVTTPSKEAGETTSRTGETKGGETTVRQRRSRASLGAMQTEPSRPPHHPRSPTPDLPSPTPSPRALPSFRKRQRTEDETDLTGDGRGRDAQNLTGLWRENDVLESPTRRKLPQGPSTLVTESDGLVNENPWSQQAPDVAETSQGSAQRFWETRERYPDDLDENTTNYAIIDPEAERDIDSNVIWEENGIDPTIRRRRVWPKAMYGSRPPSAASSVGEPGPLPPARSLKTFHDHFMPNGRPAYMHPSQLVEDTHHGSRMTEEPTGMTGRTTCK